MKTRDLVLLLPPIIVSAVFLYLYYLESFNYDNFVFTTFHFNLARFSFIPGVLWAAWTFYFLARKKIKREMIGLSVIFCLVTIPIGIQSLGSLLARTVSASKGGGYVIQKSMQKMYGDDYKFLNFVKSYLPASQEVVLVLPPNTLPWRHTGNPQIMNSYLYPIATTNNTEVKTPYMLISSETESAPYHLWPDFEVPAKEIIIFNWDESVPTIIKNKDWNPKEWGDKKPWGIIIKRDE